MNERDFSPPNCFSAAFSKLDKLRTQRELCDVVLRIGGREFHAHKLVLIACCSYFEAMFLSGMTESRQRVVELKGVNPDAFQVILRFFYTGHIKITKENVQTILPIASIFQLDDLKKACASFLEQELAPCNCLGIRAFAQTYGCTRLEEQAWKHMLIKFVEVSAAEEFFQLELAQVCQVLGCDHIKVTSEEQVFDAALRWINHSPTQRVKHMSQLLQLIRLPLLPLPVLADKVKCHHYIKDNLECRNLLDEALISYHLLPERRKSLPAERTRPRCCHYDMGVIYAVGGLSSGRGNLSSVERYVMLLMVCTEIGFSGLTLKVAVHPRGPRKHCVISYVHIQQKIRACAWGQNNSPALHSTVFIRRLRLIELLWSAGTHGKALPSNAERRARHLVQRNGSPYAF